MSSPQALGPRRTRVRRIAARELIGDDWLAVAKQSLIEEGISAVRVERLAKKLGVTRGGFYWRFERLEDLLSALVDVWVAENSRALVTAARGPGDLSSRFRDVVKIWVDEVDFSPAWDAAMRDWARVDQKVAEVVYAVDDKRIAALQAMFEDAGLSHDVALVRARIIYFHQVGYYALGIRESRARRYDLLPIYAAILSGLDVVDQGSVKPRARRLT